MTLDVPPTGLIVAGGFSRRFSGTDKALVPIDGVPMIRRIADRLAPVTDQLVVNCREDQRVNIRAALAETTATVEYAIDPTPDRGPVAGIRTGLEAVETECCAVVGCDLPFVDPGLVEQLADRACGYDGALVKLDNGWHQPLHAVYRAESLFEACRSTLDDGANPSVHECLDALSLAIVHQRELAAGVERAFTSVETPADLRAIERQL